MRYKLAEDNWDQEEIDAINQVIISKSYTMGERVREFEDSCARKFQTNHCIMVNSGSSANFVMLAAWKILNGSSWPENPEMIVPAVSWSTTYHPLYFLGIKPVYVDVDPNTFCIDLEKAKNAITEQTIGIFAVNILGQSSNLKDLSTLCEIRGIALFEDNCESMGATHFGKFTGNFGLASSQSGFYSHHISTMEGGWILSKSEEFADACRSLRAHGWIRELKSEWSKNFKSGDEIGDKFKFITPGLNFRPLEFQGAVGTVQLKKFDEMLIMRRQNAELFITEMRNLKGIRTQRCDNGSSWFAFAMILEDDATISRRELFRRLAESGVEARPLIAGNYTRQPAANLLKGRISGNLAVSDRIHDYGFYIGNHPKNLSMEIKELSGILKNLLG